LFVFFYIPIPRVRPNGRSSFMAEFSLWIFPRDNERTYRSDNAPKFSHPPIMDHYLFFLFFPTPPFFHYTVPVFLRFFFYFSPEILDQNGDASIKPLLFSGSLSPHVAFPFFFRGFFYLTLLFGERSDLLINRSGVLLQTGSSKASFSTSQSLARAWGHAPR